VKLVDISREEKKEYLKDKIDEIQIHGSVHHDSMLIKRSNLMQQYADIYSLQSHSRCFGRHSAHHQEY